MNEVTVHYLYMIQLLGDSKASSAGATNDTRAYTKTSKPSKPSGRTQRQPSDPRYKIGSDNVSTPPLQLGSIRPNGMQTYLHCPSGAPSDTGFQPPERNFPGLAPSGWTGIAPWLLACSGVEVSVGCAPAGVNVKKGL